MEVTELVVLGASNALREVSGIIRAINLKRETFRIVAALDDDDLTHGKSVSGIPVVGKLSQAAAFPSTTKFVFAIGSLKTQLARRAILAKCGIEPTRFPAIVHPSADVDESAQIGPGTIIHPGACVGPNASVGDFVIIAVNSAIGPDAKVDSYSMITSLVLVLSRACVEEEVFIGSLSCILEDIVVGKGSRVGVGSVITRNIPAGSVALGNPARVIARN